MRAEFGVDKASSQPSQEPCAGRIVLPISEVRELLLREE